MPTAWKSCFSKTLDEGRNAIEHVVSRPETADGSTRYDRIASNFPGAIRLATAILDW
jgi:hypothetical protein